MRQTFNVLFFIRKTRALKSGENPIMLRISIAGQLSEIQLKRTIKPNLWNQNKERCTGKDAASVEINRYLESVKLRLFEIHRKMEEDGKLINPMEIKRKFLGLDEEHKMFFQVFQEHNDKCRELIGKDYAKVTISRFDTCLKYFREMSLAQYQRKDIPLKEMKEKRIISAFNSELKLKGFKAFQIDDDSKETRTYSRKEFYKICLTTGKSIIHYADKSFEQEGTILFFGSTYPLFMGNYIHHIHWLYLSFLGRVLEAIRTFREPASIVILQD